MAARPDLPARFDVFVSHSSRDKQVIEQLAEQLLEEKGLHSWVDVWSIPSAANWQVEIDRALSSCRAVVVAIGVHGWGPYHLAEARSALARREREPAFPVIPVLLPGAREEDFGELSDFFRETHWVDFRGGLDAREPFERLVTAIHGEVPFPLGRPVLSPYVIRRDARRWDASRRRDRRDESLLYRGEGLRTAQQVAATWPGQLDELAIAFLREAERAGRARSRRLVVVLAAVLALVAALGIAAELGRRGAEASRREAEVARTLAEQRLRAADARRLAGQARDVADTLPQRSLLLAAAAVELALDHDDVPVTEAEQALRDGLERVDGVPLAGHGRRVTALASSRDGRWLASGDDGGTVIVRALDAAGAVQSTRVLTAAHTASIGCLAFSPDGRLLVSGGDDLVARVWDLARPDAAPQVLRGLRRDDADVESEVDHAEFSRDGRRLALGGVNSDRLLVWEVAGATLRGPTVLPGTGGQGRIPFAFHPDGTILVSESFGGNALVRWDLAVDPPQRRDLPGETAIIDVIVFTPDGHAMITAARTGAPRLWPARGPNSFAGSEPLFGVDGEIATAAFSANGHWLVAGGRSTVHRWWLPLGMPSGSLVKIHTHADDVTSVAAGDDGLVASASADGTLAIHRNGAGGVRVVRGHDGAIGQLVMGPDARWIASGADDGSVRALSLAQPEPTALTQFVRALQAAAHPGVVSAVELGPDGRWMLTTDPSGRASLWDLRATPAPRETHLGWHSVFEVAFSADDRWLAVGTLDGGARLVDLLRPDVVETVGADDAGVDAIAFSDDGRLLVTGGRAEAVEVWSLAPLDLRAARHVLRVPGSATATAAVERTGRFVVTGARDGAVRLWMLESREPIPIVLLASGPEVSASALDPRGTWIATGDDSGTIRIWRRRGAGVTAVATLFGHAGGLQRMRFTPDGSALLSKDADSLRIWRFTRDGPVTTAISIPLDSYRITSTLRIEDERWVVTQTEDMVMTRWPLDPADLVARVPGLVGRRLDPAEWARYFPGVAGPAPGPVGGMP